MHVRHVEEELLHRYFDGELRAARAAEVAAHLAACPACAGKLESLSAIRQALSDNAEESLRGIDFDAVFGRVEQGIEDRATEGISERVPVSRSRSVARRMAWPRSGARSWSRSWSRSWPKSWPGPRIWVPAAGLLAAAAAFLLMEWGGVIGLGSGRSQSAEIEQVDFGDNGGTVFRIALADGVSTNVVWINDNDDVDDPEDDNPYDNPDDSEQVIE